MERSDAPIGAPGVAELPAATMTEELRARADEDGVRVDLFCRAGRAAPDVLKSARRAPGRHLPVLTGHVDHRCQLADLDSTRRLAESALAVAGGGIDVLVNNAGGGRLDDGTRFAATAAVSADESGSWPPLSGATGLEGASVVRSGRGSTGLITWLRACRWKHRSRAPAKQR